MDVGIREFKARLSHYISEAQSGNDVVVTDRGRPVVRLVAIHSQSPLQRGIDEGWIEPARRTALPDLSERYRSERSVLDILEADRG